MTGTEPTESGEPGSTPVVPADGSETADSQSGHADRRGLKAYPIFRPRSLVRKSKLKDDGMAGLVLGVETVPDGLASGLLAGVNPVYGLYACLFGMVGGNAVVLMHQASIVRAGGAVVAFSRRSSRRPRW